jgi:glycosyltransferase involved in cell wall biosynthesis
MRALHVWPLFAAHLINGSDYHAYMLSQKLVELGVDIEVFATRSTEFRSISSFALHWPTNLPAEPELIGSLRIRRFPVTYRLPRPIAHILGRLIERRWRLEETHQGIMLAGSAQLAAYFHKRALARPRLYDWLFLLGLGPWSWPLWRRLEADIRNYDVVMVGFVPFALMWQVIVLARRHRRPVVLLPLFHPDDVFHHHRIFYECFDSAQAILAQTAYSAALFPQLAPNPPPAQVGAGVDFEAFSSPQVSGARFRARYGLSDYRLVLFVGRKEYGKRYDLAVAAVNQLNDERIRLVLVGDDVDRAPISSAYVVQLGRIPRPDLIDAYDACDLLVFPSEHESFGMVMLEAWMRRKPVVCNARCRPVASLVTHGEDGFACWNVNDLAHHIRLLLDDPARSHALGERGYRKTVANYTWSVIGQKVAALYRQLARPG